MLGLVPIPDGDRLASTTLPGAAQAHGGRVLCELEVTFPGMVLRAVDGEERHIEGMIAPWDKPTQVTRPIPGYESYRGAFDRSLSEAKRPIPLMLRHTEDPAAVMVANDDPPRTATTPPSKCCAPEPATTPSSWSARASTPASPSAASQGHTGAHHRAPGGRRQAAHRPRRDAPRPRGPGPRAHLRRHPG